MCPTKIRLADSNSIQKVENAENILNALVKNEALTLCGRDFLIANLDPMHDLQLAELRGWPDLTTASSLSVCIKQSVQLAAPNPANGNWDCVIQMNPILDEVTTKLYTRTDDLFVAPAAPAVTQLCGMVTVKSYQGVGVVGGPYGLTTQPTADQVVSLPPAFTKGKGRLIGLAFEVNNTTADLFKQGTTTVYRQPQQDMDAKTRRIVWTVGDNAQAQIAFSSQGVTFQPTTLKDAMFLAGTRQWEAKEGCYVVTGFNDEQNLALPAEYRQPTLYSSIADDVAGINNVFNLCTTEPIGATTATVHFLPHKWAPINSSGCFLSGLSQQSTLTLTVNAYYEAFPTAAEPEYAVLAKPSAEFDPLAIAMVTRAMMHMPVGVPARDNGFGDWFAGLVSEFAPMIGDALGTIIPGAGALGRGAKWLSDRYLSTSQSATLEGPRRANVRTAAPRRRIKARPNMQQRDVVLSPPAKKKVLRVYRDNLPPWWAYKTAVGTRVNHKGREYYIAG